MRLPASASENGAVAAATPGRSARRYRWGAPRTVHTVASSSPSRTAVSTPRSASAHSPPSGPVSCTPRSRTAVSATLPAARPSCWAWTRRSSTCRRVRASATSAPRPADADDVQDEQGGARDAQPDPPRVDRPVAGERHQPPHQEVHRGDARPDDGQDPHRGAGVVVGEPAAQRWRGRRLRGRLGQVAGDPGQLAAGAGGPGRLHAGVELVQVELPGGDGAAELLLDGGPLRVGHAQLVGVYRLDHAPIVAPRPHTAGGATRGRLVPGCSSRPGPLPRVPAPPSPATSVLAAGLLRVGSAAWGRAGTGHRAGSEGR